MLVSCLLWLYGLFLYSCEGMYIYTSEVYQEHHALPYQVEEKEKKT